MWILSLDQQVAKKRINPWRKKRNEAYDESCRWFYCNFISRNIMSVSMMTRLQCHFIIANLETMERFLHSSGNGSTISVITSPVTIERVLCSSGPGAIPFSSNHPSDDWKYSMFQWNGGSAVFFFYNVTSPVTIEHVLCCSSKGNTIFFVTSPLTIECVHVTVECGQYHFHDNQPGDNWTYSRFQLNMGNTIFIKPSQWQLNMCIIQWNESSTILIITSSVTIECVLCSSRSWAIPFSSSYPSDNWTYLCSGGMGAVPFS